MGSRAVSPGAALLRKSRMFSLPNALPEPPAMNLHVSEHKSPTMTRASPQHQSITTPQSSREKGDWGLKRPLPLKSTMATSTPLIRVKAIDSVESITDFASAADHTLSLEKFQELRVAMSVPKGDARSSKFTGDLWQKSVFEEHLDFTSAPTGSNHERRWKFSGPWLARLTEGDFHRYLQKSVRPRRAKFRAILKERLAADISSRQSQAARDEGRAPPPPVKPKDITDAHFNDYLRAMRNDRVTLYALVSKFLDLAPLGRPIGFVQTVWPGHDDAVPESPYGKSGPPPTHPSAGISYLRTNSTMENHPVYGPQGRKAPALARVVFPRMGPSPAKLGVGGFIANAPAGDNEFNLRYGRFRPPGSKQVLDGINHLDTTTPGGAKAYVEPLTASVDPSGKVILQLRETHGEASLVAKEAQGISKIYNARPMDRRIPQADTKEAPKTASADELLGFRPKEDMLIDALTGDPDEAGGAEKEAESSPASSGPTESKE
ncbi:hypothetical protein S7711_02804 [Stachybotrys chartarum IBT 7711]|uniref:Uncharacterized protein n=1 Tax=Stachybotrys chartarum (strain CBS 109288 / IBT 7711) TaxID=1280523 RepID=A0A084AM16_STACB|nr:hypothetical protein S7711_02804 [Stachybotrys chartarum IBT 7711]KFA49830.1 hypothetical protein S40293_01222 [Stachybotrys chartarum IBT 40293]KFA77666.1 hypothetical protein S40288_02705 [Stachybotrys chartarum IBT 40288]